MDRDGIRTRKRLDVVQGFIDRCAAGAPPQSLAGDLPKAIEALGFRYFAFCSHVDPLHPPPDAIVMHNYPAEWTRHFSESSLHEMDPVLLHAERNPASFFWDIAFRAEPVKRSQRKLLTEAARFGLAHGYTTPLHLSWLPGIRRASCSVVPDNSRVNPGNYPLVDALAMSYYVSLYRMQAPWCAALPSNLARRERQCLTLAALGKSNWEIGHILRLGETTVHTYIKRAMRRFGVASRMQAVVLALMSGEIAYGDVMCRGESGRGGRTP